MPETIAELVARRDHLSKELDKAQGQRRVNVATAYNTVVRQIEDVEQRTAHIAHEALHNPAATIPPERADRRAVPLASDREAPDLQRRHAHLMLGDLTGEGVLTTEAADHLANIFDRDQLGIDALYARAVAHSSYQSAFGKMLVHGDHASMRMTEDERHATETVFRAQQMQAAVAGPLTVGGAAGVAVPLALDPTMTLTSDGAVNPLREIARVVQISTSEWEGINTAGITASFDPEMGEVSDDTPSLGGTVVPTRMARAFCEFSIEYGGDYAGLTGELTRLIADSKDVLESTMFLTGTGGTVEPSGLLTGGTVLSNAGGTVLAVNDLYAAQDDLGARFQPNARWVGSNSTRNSVKRLVASADSDEPQIFDQAGNLLGKPYTEASQMPAIATHAKPLVYGDVRSAFVIVDRVGMAVELIPHLMGSSGRPLGARGVFAYWRVGSAVTNARAIRTVTMAWYVQLRGTPAAGPRDLQPRSGLVARETPRPPEIPRSGGPTASRRPP